MKERVPSQNSIKQFSRWIQNLWDSSEVLLLMEGWSIQHCSNTLCCTFLGNEWWSWTRNLVSRTETFLSFVLLSTWKDRFWKAVNRSLCGPKKLQILKQCSDAIAPNSCIDPELFTSSRMMHLNVLANDAENLKLQGVAENWWIEDVSCLWIDLFCWGYWTYNRNFDQGTSRGGKFSFWQHAASPSQVGNNYEN